MQKMTSTTRDKTAKIERKVKNGVFIALWKYLSIFLNFLHILVNILSHKCHLFCRKGSIQISEILFDLKYY